MIKMSSICLKDQITIICQYGFKGKKMLSKCRHIWLCSALKMFGESLSIHYMGGSHVGAAVVGVQQKVHGVLITPCGPPA